MPPAPDPDEFDGFDDMPEGSSYPEGESSESVGGIEEAIRRAVDARCGAIDSAVAELSREVAELKERMAGDVAALARRIGHMADGHGRGADPREVADANAVAKRIG